MLELEEATHPHVFVTNIQQVMLYSPQLTTSLWWKTKEH